MKQIINTFSKSCRNTHSLLLILSFFSEYVWLIDTVRKILSRQGQKERLLGKPCNRWVHTVKTVVNSNVGGRKLYKVIRKSLQDFRPLRYSSRDGNEEGEHVNRGRDTPSFCPTLQVLDMSTLGDAAYVNPAESPRLDISSTCKVGQKLGVSLPLLTCSTSAWPSRLLYRRGRKSRRDLWITLYLFGTEYGLVMGFYEDGNKP